MSSSFIDHVLGSREREAFMSACPALALLCYQCVVAGLRTGNRVADPFPADTTDAVSDLLSASTVSDIISRVFGTGETEGCDRSPFWYTLRVALESVCDPRSQTNTALYAIAGVPRVQVASRQPLARTSLLNALRASRVKLRAATSCALAGSLSPLGADAKQPLAAMLQFARIVPESGATTATATAATAEGLHFAMQPLPQQWWALVSVSLDRALALAGEGAQRGELWQLLAVLFALDSAGAAFPFPVRGEDPAAFHLLARLAEVGLVYPLLVSGARCFALSPHFRHALWCSAPALLCTEAMLDEDKGAAEGMDEEEGKGNGEKNTHTAKGNNNINRRARVRREDEDTIVTETNFRLYAYTRSPDLLNILDQFAVREAEVGRMIVCFRVTRASFAAALQKGITAAHILRFLSVRAHPSMLRHYCNAADGEDAARRKRLRSAGDARAGMLIPQSFCDQLMTWESECQRLVFVRGLVLLRNLSPAQSELITSYLADKGERGAVVREDVGCLIVRRDAYEALLAPLIVS